MRLLICVAFLGVTVSLPARAEPPAMSPDAFLGGLVQENDATLLFSYLREAFGAALRGREVRPPYEIQQRAESIAEELKRRGAAAGHVLLDEIERGIREELRQRPRIPPSDVRQRI